MSQVATTSSSSTQITAVMPTGSRERRIDVRSSLMPALASGAVQAVVFNPYDRALYLRVHHRTLFLDPSNWSHPFQGFGNSALYRTIAGATYLFWQDEATRIILAAKPDIEAKRRRFCVGLMAGAMNGLFLNPMQLVKFRMWASGDSATFGSSFRQLIAEGGPHVLGRGVVVSMLRDVTFGVTYECLRFEQVLLAENRSTRMAYDCTAGMVASVASSPFNFARNLIFSAPPAGCPLSMTTLLSFLQKETKALPTWGARFRHLNSRLNVGWGTLRVGVGMGAGQLIFRSAQAKLAPNVSRSVPKVS
jgi:hypothetical protein